MTAHELIELAAQQADGWMEGDQIAADIRALKSTIPDGVICEAEPVSWCDRYNADRNQYDTVPLYRAAKEPTK